MLVGSGAGSAADTRPPTLAWLQLAVVVILVGPILLLGYAALVCYGEPRYAGRAELARLAQIGQELDSGPGAAKTIRGDHVPEHRRQ